MTLSAHGLTAPCVDDIIVSWTDTASPDRLDHVHGPLGWSGLNMSRVSRNCLGLQSLAWPPCIYHTGPSLRSLLLQLGVLSRKHPRDLDQVPASSVTHSQLAAPGRSL